MSLIFRHKGYIDELQNYRAIILSHGRLLGAASICPASAFATIEETLQLADSGFRPSWHHQSPAGRHHDWPTHHPPPVAERGVRRSRATQHSHTVRRGLLPRLRAEHNIHSSVLSYRRLSLQYFIARSLRLDAIRMVSLISRMW